METEFPTFLLSSKSSIRTSSEFRLYIEPKRMASRGFEAFATSDGFPEKIVGAQPQSLSSSLKAEFLSVTKDDRDDGNVVFGLLCVCPLLD
jgi:hypothetical protein